MVEVKGLTQRYGDLVAVRELSFDVEQGEMFGLIGPDGAGKTTVLRTVLGLLAPTAGSVTACGLTPSTQRRSLARRVGYLSQRFSLYGDLTVDENIGFFAEIHDVRGWRARRDELLDLVRLSPFRRRLADRLSGGMKQKLALACTLIHTPELLVLDEPTTGVDPLSRRDFWTLLARLQRDGLTILLTTPYLDEAERCGRVALMHQGSLLVVDEPGNLRSEVEGVFVEIVAHPRRDAVRRLREHPEIADVEVFGNRLHVFVPDLHGAGAGEAPRHLEEYLVTGGIRVDSARISTPSLEDIFIRRIRATTTPPGEEPR